MAKWLNNPNQVPLSRLDHTKIEGKLIARNHAPSVFHNENKNLLASYSHKNMKSRTLATLQISQIYYLAVSIWSKQSDLHTSALGR